MRHQLQDVLHLFLGVLGVVLGVWGEISGSPPPLGRSGKNGLKPENGASPNASSEAFGRGASWALYTGNTKTDTTVILDLRFGFGASKFPPGWTLRFVGPKSTTKTAKGRFTVHTGS